MNGLLAVQFFGEPISDDSYSILLIQRARDDLVEPRYSVDPCSSSRTCSFTVSFSRRAENSSCLPSGRVRVRVAAHLPPICFG
jgi:hypothetical protein